MPDVEPADRDRDIRTPTRKDSPTMIVKPPSKAASKAVAKLSPKIHGTFAATVVARGLATGGYHRALAARRRDIVTAMQDGGRYT